MSTISFGGLASGIDTDAIINALMEAERQPLKRLEQTKEFEEARLDAFRVYNDKLRSLNDSISGLFVSSAVRQSSVSLSSEQHVTATATSASPGSYTVAVEQTAQVQKSVSADAHVSRTENIFGGGEIDIVVGEGADAKTVTISLDDEGGSLVDIMSAINRTSGEHGVSASIIDAGEDSEGGRYYLMLTGADSSTRFTVESRLGEGDAVFAVSETPQQEARQAVAYIDGIRVTSRTNTITNALNGVTLNLESTSPRDEGGELVPTTMTIDVDKESLVEKIEAFVAAYNDIVHYVRGINQGEEPEAGAGMLQGDSLVSTVTRRLQGFLSLRATDSGTYDALSQLGISTRRDGTVNLDTNALENALKTDYDQVVEMLAGDSGVFKDYRAYLNSTTSTSDGLFAIRQETTKSTFKRIDTDIERMETRLERREEFLMLRFSAMEQMVNVFNAQSEFLTNQMDRMPSFGGRKK